MQSGVIAWRKAIAKQRIVDILCDKSINNKKCDKI